MRDPTGSRKTPGSTTAPTISTTTTPDEAAAPPAPVRAPGALAVGDPPGSVSPPSTSTAPWPVPPNASTNAAAANASAASPMTAILRAPGGTPPGARSGDAAVGAVFVGAVSIGDSSVRQGGVAVGSTSHSAAGGPSRDSAGRVTSRHVGGHFPTRRDVGHHRSGGRLAATYRGGGIQRISQSTQRVPSHQRCHVPPSRPGANTSMRSAPQDEAAGVPASTPPRDSQGCQAAPSQ